MIELQRIGCIAALAAAAATAACTNTPLYGPTEGGYTPAAVGYQAPATAGYPAPQGYAQWGMVTRVEVIRGERSGGTVGTIAGGVVGGVAGNQVGGGTGPTVATVIGAVGGALIGRAIEQNTQAPSEDHYRVTVRLEDGSLRNFQYREPPNVREGERVRVDGNELYR